MKSATKKNRKVTNKNNNGSCSNNNNNKGGKRIRNLVAGADKRHFSDGDDSFGRVDTSFPRYLRFIPSSFPVHSQFIPSSFPVHSQFIPSSFPVHSRFLRSANPKGRTRMNKPNVQTEKNVDDGDAINAKSARHDLCPSLIYTDFYNLFYYIYVCICAALNCSSKPQMVGSN